MPCRAQRGARLTSFPDRPNKLDKVLDWSPADARAVSTPCVEWFAEQDDSYQQEVLPAHVRGARVSLERFGESAGYQTVYREFGFTAEHVVTAAKASLARVRAR